VRYNRSDLADLLYFLAIARHRSFRRAGVELGVSASALSHSLKGLEARLGVRLVNRTSRSVTLTAAGEELRAAIGGAVETIGDAVENLNRFRDAPAGRIRINAPEHAATLVLVPALPAFLELYPDIEIDLAVDNRMVDVIDRGFDAGVRYGGTVPEDMVAQRLSGDIRWVVAGAPAYLAKYGKPMHPNDLLQHRCLNFRLGDDRLYEWEFERGDEELVIGAPSAVMIDNSVVATRLAQDGAGLTYLPEASVSDLVADGELEIVLEEWAPIGPGFYIYYPSRRQVPTALRLLIDHIRALRPLGL
jgi:DNA-binding transcriptional LysR family regulator